METYYSYSRIKDADGNVTITIDKNGHKETYNYDPDGNPKGLPTTEKSDNIKSVEKPCEKPVDKEVKKECTCSCKCDKHEDKSTPEFPPKKVKDIPEVKCARKIDTPLTPDGKRRTLSNKFSKDDAAIVKEFSRAVSTILDDYNGILDKTILADKLFEALDNGGHHFTRSDINDIIRLACFKNILEWRNLCMNRRGFNRIVKMVSEFHAQAFARSLGGNLDIGCTLPMDWVDVQTKLRHI